MLKDMIEKHTEIVPVSDRINVVDMLTNEGAVESMKQDFKQLTSISKDINTFTGVMENLTNESGLVSYLASQGYEDITTESAGDKAKEIWDKVVKFIKDLISKFKIVYNNLKIKVYAYLNDKDKIIDSLINIAKQINTPLNENEYFSPGEKLPIIEDLSNPQNYTNMFKEWGDSIVYILHNQGDTLFITKVNDDGSNFKDKDVNDVKVKRVINFADGKLKGIYLDNNLQFKIDHIDSKIDYKARESKIPTPSSIVNILTNFKDFNKKARTEFIEKILKSIEDLEKRLSDSGNYKKVQDFKENSKILKDTLSGSDIYSYKNAPHNCSMLIRASEVMMRDIPEITQNIIYLMSHAIKCYDKK